MHNNRIKLATLAVLMMALMVLGTGTIFADETQEHKITKAEESNALLHPEKATLTAPASYTVKVVTTAGDFVIEVKKEWAPNGADRFYNLIKIGYYDDTAFFRVVDGFMAQIGFHGDPEVNKLWRSARFDDDPIVKTNTRGMVTFAMTGQPNSRTTQFFINYGNNTYLKKHGKFAPFGKVIEGMDIVNDLYSGYGEGAPQGKGPSQGRIATEGNAYLQKDFSKLDYIITARIVE